MWRVVAAIYALVVVLAALYNIASYSGILRRAIYPLTQSVSPVVLKKVPDEATNETSVISNHHSPPSNTSSSLPLNSTLTAKFYLIPTPEITADLFQKNINVSVYYDWQLNEESAEVWLHRGFETLFPNHRTMDPSQADVFLIPGYFHLARLGNQASTYVTDTIMKRIYNKSMPHVVLCPTWNPEMARESGIAPFLQQLQREGLTNLYSVGLERNPSWQTLEPSRIIPIPYVVRPSLSRDELISQTLQTRHDDFVFYAGNSRKHAMEWSGCNRSMILPLANNTNMDVSLRSTKTRLSQQDYNLRMFTSDYCLILCGDTVTSRSLTSAMVYGCLPIQVGSRWNGVCDAPCKPGFGWTVTGPDYPHLPFTSVLNWTEYPQVDEADFHKNPLATLQHMFQEYQSNKTKLRADMLQHQLGFIYGWGNPVTSNEFGQATEYIWRSIVVTLKLE